ncbi:tyrosine-type recombinase/integrase [Lactonifactor longoviformis]|uniref:tyrosine-type recombinase/integrase n=1 Tax=Lactonifactor longoviformis TaxID=341220 RepID=UPI001D00F31A|nr:tyrosine-type recombinase/integrase [Lactonifactor longoviformis]MCB5714289.1 tyrosine-type recombinase/integrase [Lactonifactor longoviformis]MCB5718244.1 tyrosine-type recombinase/integrase [Lactonifactor longoviformis]MCQ4671706.1 tyrosine-type recombinase/integrase [Lactonifactor longoviformis]
MRDRDKMELYIQKEDIQDFQEFLYEREYSTATISKYLTDVHTFLKFAKGKDVIEKSLLLRYKEWLMQNYAVSSVNSMLVSLNQLLEYLGGGFLKLKRVKVQKQNFADEDKEMSKEEYIRLKRAAAENGKAQLALIIETICSTGIRISELSYFTVERVRKGYVEVHNKGKSRTILLPEKLRRKLIYYVKKHNILSGCIFVTRNGKPKDRSNLWAEMKALYKEAEVSPEKIFPHNLRHLFARVYYSLTKDLAGLADILGHSSMEVTRIYTAHSGNVYQKRIDSLGLVN